MSLLNFISQYPDEESCRRQFKAYRDRVGVRCVKCGGSEHYWKADRDQYECKGCRTRQTLRSNTVMHGSKLPFRYWFIAAHLLTSTRKSFSALEVQRQLGHKYYEPIWAMLHKLRQAMGGRDARYSLKGFIELDDGFFSVPVEGPDWGKPLKRGRGSQRKAKVLVMAESRPVDEKDKKIGKGKKGRDRKVGYLKMMAIDSLAAEDIEPHVANEVSTSSTIDSDGSTSYSGLGEMVEGHRPKVVPRKEAGKALPWVHIAISNAKRLFLGVHHSIKREYLQNYLDEYCYKFNRRYFGEGLFDRLLVAAVSHKNSFRHDTR